MCEAQIGAKGASPKLGALASLASPGAATESIIF